MFDHLVRGAAGGVLATVAMSAVMLAGGKAGLMPGQPPKHIVRALLPGHKRRPKPGEKGLGALAHLGFGAASGALFGLMSGDRHARVPVGVGYALLIWVASYQGWIPAMNILPPISRDPEPGRPAVMAAGHVVYGTVLVMALNRLHAGRRGHLPARAESSGPGELPAGATSRTGWRPGRRSSPRSRDRRG